LPNAAETMPAQHTTLTREPASPVAFVRVPSTVTSPYPCAAQETSRLSSLAALRPTALLAQPGVRLVGTGAPGGYGGDLLGRIEDYARRCDEMTRGEPFDVIHAHDWVTFPAGMRLAAQRGKPLVVHVHSTEFDRSGEAINTAVYEVERCGMEAARTIVAVSHLTKGVIVQRYGIPADKVRVVHNGIDGGVWDHEPRVRNGHPQTVLFLGRLTRQKGPEYFVRAAARVLSRRNGVQFVIAGWGDLGPRIVEQVAGMGLGRYVRFAGFLCGDEVEQAYRMADVYVMPSISEPFGLTALEALRCGVPVVISKHSGVAEVLPLGAIKVDYWDVDLMADRILALLNHPPLGEALCRRAAAEMRPLTWDEAARRCVGVYDEQVDALRG
jgi:glycosyltransferase involved in cell wall biosynthesis